MANYVLVPGGGHGGWCYKRVVALLEADGHVVYAPTLTGLGERSHLVSADTDLDTHITDVVNLLFYEDLSDVILVGHSYGGMVIRGIADRAADRIGRMVYLDAPAIKNGQKVCEASPGLLKMREGSREIDGVELFAFPSEEMAGLYGVTDPDDVVWVTERLTAHPWKAVDQPLIFTDEAALEEIPEYHVVATAFDAIHRDEEMIAKARAEGRVWEIDSGHDVMITEPQAVATSLTEIAAAVRP